MKVGAVNADEHKSLASRYGISGFPSIKFFGDGRKPVDYEGVGATPFTAIFGPIVVTAFL